MSRIRTPGPRDYVAHALRQYFEGHGVRTTLDGDIVRFPDHSDIWADGNLYSRHEQITQLDVRLGGFDGDRFLCESVVGIGRERSAQFDMAMKVFANASFHVLLPAFFGAPPCHGTERETWVIGGRPRDVYSGLITTFLNYPPPAADGMPDLGFFPKFITRLETTELPPGTHWIRIAQERIAGEIGLNEVLLDNEPWPKMMEFMAGLDWPFSEKSYDVRVFLIVREKGEEAEF